MARLAQTTELKPSIDFKEIKQRFFAAKKVHLQRAWRRFNILTMYIMSSTCRIGHSHHSDFDTWVCYDNNHSREQIDALETKSSAIEAWAHILEVNVHILLVSSEELREGKQWQCIALSVAGRILSQQPVNGRSLSKSGRL